MKKVVSIDGVILDNKLFISSEFDIDDYVGTKSIAIDGSSVMFIQAKGAFTKEVSITSKDNGWISADTKDLLTVIVNGSAKTVVFDDASEETYYFDHSKKPMVFQPLFEGSPWYTVTINLLKG